MSGFFLTPVRDFLGAVRATQTEPPWRGLLAAFAGLLASWWLYVPAHELSHAFGCLAAGGTVERLEISPEYGAALLRAVFPFVVVGSDYAGQLTGFDTYDNDFIYLATVYAPYVLTIFLGVPLLRRLARRTSPGTAPSALLGASLPFAYAPFTNVLGDFYELGSILVSRVASHVVPAADPLRWRSDDLVKLVRELDAAGSLGVADAIGLPAGFAVGCLCALATYALGTRVRYGFRASDRARRNR